MTDAEPTSSPAHAQPTRDAPPRRRVVFCWTHISGYMAACWRAMSRTPDLEPHVIALASQSGAATFDPAIMAGVSCTLLDTRTRTDPATIAAIVRECAPDVLVVAGWAHAPYRRMIERGEVARVPTVMAMDTPWRGDWRQRLVRHRLRRYLRRIDRVMVTGERCWQYARRLGFDERRIHRGVYGIDYDALSRAHRRDTADGWPRRLLFVGRYERQKGVDVLLEAYRRYRATHTSPLALTCCGAGPLEAQVRGAEGVTDRGFVQPADLPAVFAEHGALVLASRYDPWPLVIVEACAAGLAVVCTAACGSAVELVRCESNGWIVPTDDADALAAALGRVHTLADEPGALATIGERGRPLAAAYASDIWVARWRRMIAEITA